MSWVPVFKLSGNSPPIKNGNVSGIISDGIATITFSNSFADTNYTVSITPYVSASTITPPQAYVIFDETYFTPSGFKVQTINASGFFWTAIYGSNS